MKSLDNTRTALEKEQNLRRWMRERQSVLVAYSGGVDSVYLAYIAGSELGGRAVAVLGLSPSVSAVQRNEAVRAAQDLKFNFETIETNELDDDNYRANPANRCYFCKSELYQKLEAFATRRGIPTIVDGTNFDDVGGHRPGRKAADEHNIRSPLVEMGMTKDEIRLMSKRHGLPTWDKPASPCLSSRIAYGIPVTIERLSKIERGEDILRARGFREFRVRVHGDLVRIEISPNEISRALNKNVTDELAEQFSILGFKFVTLDLHGYRSGAMNAALKE